MAWMGLVVLVRRPLVEGDFEGATAKGMPRFYNLGATKGAALDLHRTARAAARSVVRSAVCRPVITRR
jgi:hypothetical protein